MNQNHHLHARMLDLTTNIAPLRPHNPNRRCCNKRRLTASDYQEGNRRDYNMSGSQTSGKEGGVQCVMMVVYMYVRCMHVCLISCMSDSEGRLKLGLPL